MKKFNELSPAHKLIFSNLPDELKSLDEMALSDLITSAEFSDVGANQEITSDEWTRPRTLYLASGLLAIQVLDIDQQLRINNFLQESQIFSTATIPKGVIGFRIKALRASRIISWPDEGFENTLAKHPKAIYWVLQRVKSQMETRYVNQLQQMRLQGPAQLAYLMWNLSSKGQEGTYQRHFDVRINQSILANYLGISREEISRRRVRLEAAGYLERVDGGFVLSPSVSALFTH